METFEGSNITFGGDVAALFTALSKAQAQMGAAKKGAANPHFRSKFADLATVLEAVLPPLNEHGLALVQFPGMAEDKVTLTTMITHSGGGWICSVAATATGRKNDAQAVGSAITYLRRYCAQAALALPAVDDDGEAAMGRGNNRKPEPKKSQSKRPAENRKGFQKAFEAPVKAPPQNQPHASWAEDWKPFMEEALKFVTPKEGQSDIDAVVEEAAALGYLKRPSQMTNSERAHLLGALSGEIF